MRDGTYKKTVAWETTISVDKSMKRGMLILKFQALQSEYKVFFFFLLINCLSFWKSFKYVLQVKQMGSFKRGKLVNCKYKLKSVSYTNLLFVCKFYGFPGSRCP